MKKIVLLILVSFLMISCCKKSNSNEPEPKKNIKLLFSEQIEGVWYSYVEVDGKRCLTQYKGGIWCEKINKK